MVRISFGRENYEGSEVCFHGVPLQEVKELGYRLGVDSIILDKPTENTNERIYITFKISNIDITVFSE